MMEENKNQIKLKDQIKIDDVVLVKENMKKKINLKIISKWAFILTMLILVGASGFVMGKYQTKDIKGFTVGVRSEILGEIYGKL